jgi:hypothetical protein
MSDGQALSKTEVIAQLQTTIGQLEGIIQTLQTESAVLPDRLDLDNLVNTTTQLRQTLSPIPSSTVDAKINSSVDSNSDDFDLLEPEDEDEEIVDAVQSIDRLLPSFNRLQSWWDRVLGQIRQWLPKKINEKLTDWGLTSLLTGLVVIVLLTSVVLVASPSSTVDSSTTAEVNGINNLPSSQPSFPEPIAAPENLEAPAEPKPIELAPPSPPPLTPEQSLLGAIQREVDDLTRRYPDGLILAIAPDFDHNHLTLTLADSWYRLTPKRQDTLADGIFKRSQKLTFQKLSLIRGDGTLLARSPVVGQTMIIVQRQLPEPVTPSL